jgi:hypothetical protein
MKKEIIMLNIRLALALAILFVMLHGGVTAQQGTGTDPDGHTCAADNDAGVIIDPNG